MKIIQITDTHLMPRGTDLHGLNPCERLEACIASINEFHPDAELCIITGDLTDRGHPEAYQDFREILQQLRIPYHPLIGNHDHREIFSEVFPEVPLDENGFVQQMLKTTEGRLLLLDTVKHKKDEGTFCKKREMWLRNHLEESGSENVYLFMHHPPFKIGIPALDRIRLQEGAQRIQQIVNDFSNIKHLFFGHVHRPVSGSWQGIPFTALCGTNHQILLDLATEDYLTYSHEPPAYSVILLESKQTTVHYQYYLDNFPYMKSSLNP
ncbi:MAG: phosphodiesterase [SAR324 cluster bacterium]|nr:phosphodiesterase [SAR324 cluster bacterium]